MLLISAFLLLVLISILIIRKTSIPLVANVMASTGSGDGEHQGGKAEGRTGSGDGEHQGGKAEGRSGSSDNSDKEKTTLATQKKLPQNPPLITDREHQGGKAEGRSGSADHEKSSGEGRSNTRGG